MYFCTDFLKWEMIAEGYIKLDDFQIFVKDIKINAEKEQPLLIFLHDSWGCVEMWDDFPEKLSKLLNQNALVYDRRGHGRSSAFEVEERTTDYLQEEADILIRLMDSLSIPKAILYGHSDGATIALIAAACYPNRFAGLILESPHTFMEESGINAVRTTRDKAMNSSLLEKLEKFHGEKTSSLFRLWHETWLSKHFAEWTIVPLLKNIICPVLAFRGENDSFDTEEQLNVLKKEIRGAVQLAKIPNAAHAPHKENENETMRRILAFSH